MAVKTESKLKKKKKRWFPILASRLFNNRVLGESFVSDASLLKGKYITTNLMTVTGEMKNQNVNVSFEVDNVTDGKGQASLVSYTMIPNSLKRFIRRGRSRVDDSIKLKTADGLFIQIKPVIITQTLATRLIKTQLRVQTRNMLFSMAQRYPYEKLVSEIIFQRIQKNLKDVLKKITPVKSVGIRMFKLLKTEPKMYLTQANYKLKKEIPMGKKELPREEVEEEPSQGEKVTPEERTETNTEGTPVKPEVKQKASNKKDL
jgi:ribosomal protein S3AE